MGKFFFETYGCQMNKAESAAIQSKMRNLGWSPAERAEEADMVVIHTCSVRQSAENRIWGRIGRFTAMKKSRNFTLAVIGCMAERLKDEIKQRAPAADLVLGNYEKLDVGRYLNGENYHCSVLRSYPHSLSFACPENFRAFLPIMHGCSNYCSYCIVPHVRGGEVSRPAEKIIAELKDLEAGGVREVTLLGQNVNSYAGEYRGRILSFPGLLELVLKETCDIPWFRFLTSHPKDFSDELISCIKMNRRLCSNVHLPLQHGSDRILSRMNRGYTLGRYKERVDRLRVEVPGVTVSTDILIGFPGETEEDFKDTITALETMQFDDAFTYKYNIRKGTKAAEMEGQLDEETKQQRLAHIIEIQRKIVENTKRRRAFGTQTVLVEQISKKNGEELLGRNEYNDMVVFRGEKSLIGKMVKIKITGFTGTTCKGELL
jgi:tRNA-2-methylthio-N6-dimethylallyladenosine synthase